jgi:hypothetical protein
MNKIGPDLKKQHITRLPTKSVLKQHPKTLTLRTQTKCYLLNL